MSLSYHEQFYLPLSYICSRLYQQPRDFEHEILQCPGLAVIRVFLRELLQPRGALCIKSIAPIILSFHYGQYLLGISANTKKVDCTILAWNVHAVVN